MLAQPWMNRAPINPPTPLQRAQCDMRYWKNRIEELRRGLAEAEHQYCDAADRIAKL